VLSRLESLFHVADCYAGSAKETWSRPQAEVESFCTAFHLRIADPHLHTLIFFDAEAQNGGTVVEKGSATGAGGCRSCAHSASM
jgi:hypothetical protein